MARTDFKHTLTKPIEQFAKNRLQAAYALRISRPTVVDWCARNPGKFETSDGLVDCWALYEFAMQRVRDGQGVAPVVREEGEEPPPRDPASDFAARKLKAQALQAELDFEIARGKVVDREWAIELFKDLVNAIAVPIQELPRQVGPALEERSALDCTSILQERIDAIMDGFDRRLKALPDRMTAPAAAKTNGKAVAK